MPNTGVQVRIWTFCFFELLVLVLIYGGFFLSHWLTPDFTVYFSVSVAISIIFSVLALISDEPSFIFQVAILSAAGLGLVISGSISWGNCFPPAIIFLFSLTALGANSFELENEGIEYFLFFFMALAVGVSIFLLSYFL